MLKIYRFFFYPICLFSSISFLWDKICHPFCNIQVSHMLNYCGNFPKCLYVRCYTYIIQILKLILFFLINSIIEALTKPRGVFCFCWIVFILIRGFSSTANMFDNIVYSFASAKKIPKIINTNFLIHKI